MKALTSRAIGLACLPLSLLLLSACSSPTPDVLPDLPSDLVPDDTATDAEDDDNGDEPPEATAGALYEPADGRIYHGVGPVESDVAAYLTALDKPAIKPLVEGVHMSIPGTRPESLGEAIQAFLARADAGGRVPHLSLAFQKGQESTDVVIASSTEYDDLIDMAAALVANFDKPVFVRLGFEFNGGWNAYTPVFYPEAFRKVVDRFRTLGADKAAFIWCYEPDGPNDFDVVENGKPAWYPGDDYVDWFGLDVFKTEHFAETAPTTTGNGALSAKGKSDRFLEMAREHNKPVFLSETAAIRTYPTSDEMDPGFADGISDWQDWFVPFFDWMASHDEIKGYIYLNQDFTGTPKWDDWGNTSIQVNSYIRDQYRAAVAHPSFVHASEGLLGSGK